MEETLDVVDEEDKFVRKATRKEVREKGLLHRVAMVIIANKERKVLIQKRSMLKDIHPGYWDIGMGETVISGESYEAAAIRGLLEELNILGVSNIQLKNSFLFKLKYRSPNDNANLKVYLLNYDGEIRANKEEIEEIKVVTTEEAASLTPFVPSGTMALKEYLAKK